jgi:hypothetical protein
MFHCRLALVELLGIFPLLVPIVLVIISSFYFNAALDSYGVES